MKMRPNEEVQKNRDSEKVDEKQDANTKGFWSKQEKLAITREQTFVRKKKRKG